MRTFLTNFKFTNMSQRLPQGTRLWVNINRCKGLPNVRMGRRTSERLTKQRVEKAQKKLSGVIRSITENNWRGAKKGIEEAQVALRRAEAVLRDMGSEVVPNPFAALRVEGDAYNEQSLSETRVIGSTNGPLWNTERSNIRLDRNGHRLVFFIYHDDAVRDRGGVPGRTDRTWRRETSQRSHCIGKAFWQLGDIHSAVGMGEFQRSFPVLDPVTNKEIRGAELTIQAKLWVRS